MTSPHKAVTRIRPHVLSPLTTTDNGVDHTTAQDGRPL